MRFFLILSEFICLSGFRQCLGNAVWGSDQGFGIQVTYFYQELYYNILSERQTQQSNNLFGRISKTSFHIFRSICKINFFLLDDIHVCTVQFIQLLENTKERLRHSYAIVQKK